jgi:hypothetical protein
VKLTGLQKLVMLAALAMFAAAMLDIFDVIAPPNWVWIVVPITLGLLSWAILPTMKELTKANRRG